MLLINSFSGDFSDGVLELREASAALEGGGFSQSAAPSEISFSGGLVFEKECSCFPCAFSPLPLWYWLSRVFSRVSAC